MCKNKNFIYKINIKRSKLRLAKLKLIITFISLVFALNACTLFESDKRLPQLHISTDVHNLQLGDYIEGTLSYYKNDTFNLQLENFPIQLKYRGNVSAFYEKKCYSLKLSQKYGFNQFEKHKKWKLNAEYIDKTFMRNKLSYDLFRSFSDKNFAPKIIYTNLYLNNIYKGIYTLTERVDEDRLNFFKKDTLSVLFKEAPISYAPKEHAKRHENFIAYSYWAECYKSFSEEAMDKLIGCVYYNQRFPKNEKQDKKYLIYQLTDFIFNSSNIEFKTDSVFNRFFDLNNIIDWHLLLLLTNNSDGLIKNYYLYKKGHNHPFCFCPWDYDHSFGRDGDGEPSPESFIDISRMKLLVRLLETNAFEYRKRLYDKFMYLKKNDVLTSRNINEMIDENVSVILPYMDENELLWPMDSLAYFKGSSFINEVSMMRTWVDIRLAKLEKYLASLNIKDGR